MQEPGRQPAVPVVLALGTGIVLDRLLAFPLTGWLTAGSVTTIIATAMVILRRRDRGADETCGAPSTKCQVSSTQCGTGDDERGKEATKERIQDAGKRTENRKLKTENSPPHRADQLATLLLLLAILAVGGARHHLFWSIREGNNVSRYSPDVPAPVRIVGVIETSVDLIRSEQGPRIPSWMQLDHSSFVLRCERIEDAAAGTRTWLPVSGRVRVDVDGQLVHAGVGDRVELLGRIVRPGSPRNPGGFEFDRFLRSKGTDAVVRVRHPVAVTRIETLESPWWRIARLRESVRGHCRTLFVQNLSPSSVVLAGSLLLGDRSLMTDELRRRFTESGTMHLLAISGLHVGILVGMLFLLCRGLNLSSRSTAIFLILVVISYALLTNHRPPVLRATVLATISLIGLATYRRTDGMNTLAVTAALLLLWRPADLFDIGAQLSFLAVGAILWASRSRLWMGNADPLAGLPAPERPAWIERLIPPARWLLHGYVITGAIWLATVPLTISTFHLVAPIGYLLNVLLIPFIAVVLGLGYLFLFTGLLLPVLAGPLGMAFDWCLETLLEVVGLAQSASWGHFYLPHLPGWWLIGFYLLLGTAWGLWRVPAVRWPGRERGETGQRGNGAEEQRGSTAGDGDGATGGQGRRGDEGVDHSALGPRPSVEMTHDKSQMTNSVERSALSVERSRSRSTLNSQPSTPNGAWRVLLVWILIGLIPGTAPKREPVLRCTFLSVGHGLASVLELPSGETILYDAGTIGDGRLAERAVEQYLWSRRIDRIDAIVLSHPDHDHYSGVFGLLEKFPVGTLFVARSFLDFEQRGVVELCDAAAATGVPIRLIEAGDRLLLRPGGRRADGQGQEGREQEGQGPRAEGQEHDGSPSATIDVVHPPDRFESPNDNAHSVVLDVRFAERRLLLTGDLDKEGLDRVLTLPAEKVDVLLSPHHGGETANPRELLEWASPEYVIVSTSRDDVHDRIAERVHPADLLTTRASGAITVEIHMDGTSRVHEWNRE
jgi:ComEC/Rec2-related protein